MIAAADVSHPNSNMTNPCHRKPSKHQITFLVHVSRCKNSAFRIHGILCLIIYLLPDFPSGMPFSNCFPVFCAPLGGRPKHTTFGFLAGQKTWALLLEARGGPGTKNPTTWKRKCGIAHGNFRIMTPKTHRQDSTQQGFNFWL